MLHAIGRGFRVQSVDSSCGQHLEEMTLPDLEGSDSETMSRQHKRTQPTSKGRTLNDALPWLVEWDLNSFYGRNDLDDGREDI